MVQVRSSDKTEALRRASALSFFLALCLLLGLSFGTAGPSFAAPPKAKQGWVVCNATSFILRMASARPIGSRSEVSGWLRMRPGECRLVLEAPLTKGDYLLYAESSAVHRGGTRNWSGDRVVCIDERAKFTVDNAKDCAATGLQQRFARLVQVSQRESWVTYFSEIDVPGLAAARTAGIKRLLDDAGYGAAPVRSLLARRTDDYSGSLARFRAEKRIATTATEETLIDALENAARERRAKVGMRICNRTKSKVWTAIAARRPEGWESRGWWGLEPNACAKVINDDLYQPLYYVHAAMETPRGDRLLTSGSVAFCVGRAKFAIIGHDDCQRRQFSQTLFAAFQTNGASGVEVNLEDSWFQPLELTKRPVGGSAAPAVPALPPKAAGDAAAAAAAPPIGGPPPGTEPLATAPRPNPGPPRPVVVEVAPAAPKPVAKPVPAAPATGRAVTPTPAPAPKPAVVPGTPGTSP